MSEHIDKQVLLSYEPIKKIGSGAYGHVWKVIDKNKKTIHALKKNFDAFQNSTDAQRTYREIIFLQQLRHPNIITMENIIKAENDKDIYLLFEYMDIDLYALIRENILGEKHKKYIIYQIAKAMYFLHTADLVHRDIKPSNVLVNENCQAKICDFGLVRSVDDETEAIPILTEYIATRWYRAPEILLGSKKYSKAIDIWSFGCLLGEIIKGKPLFPGSSTLNQIERVLMWTGPPSLSDIKALKTDFGKEMLELLSKIKPLNKKEWLPSCSEDAMDLLMRTLEFNPEKRYTMLDVLKHPYLEEFYNSDEIIVAKNPIKADVSDNQKLTIKDYRNMIYKQIKHKDEIESCTKTLKSSVLEKNAKEIGNRELMETSKTIHKDETRKPVRSASKERDNSAQNTYKDGRSINIKKKYESLFGKRLEFSKTKYVVKTEEDAPNTMLVNKKKCQPVSNMGSFYLEKKKKSVSGYEQKRQSEVIARYMYKNRFI